MRAVPYELPEGTRIGPYRVEGPLGRGATATVVRARHQRLGSRHALKILIVPSPIARARFLQEGRVQATLRHPHVVPVTDVLEWEGQLVLVQRWIRGPSLARLLAAGRLTPPQVDVLARGITAGTAAVHERGWVHRDLKPSNILLDPGHDGLTPKVADFGLARMLDADPDATEYTRTGVGLGTPGFMAPEQLRNAREVDARADVFSLGCVLYELIAGVPALPTEDPIEAFDRVRNGEIPPLPPDTPEAWRIAVEGCLHPEPADRWSDAGALLEAWCRDLPHADLPTSLSDFTLDDDLITPAPGRVDGAPPPRWLGWSLLTGGLLALTAAAAQCAIHVPEPDEEEGIVRCEDTPCGLDGDVAILDIPGARRAVGPPGSSSGKGVAALDDWDGDGRPELLSISIATERAWLIDGGAQDLDGVESMRSWSVPDVTMRAWRLTPQNKINRAAIGAPKARGLRGRVYLLDANARGGEIEREAYAVYEGKSLWQAGFSLTEFPDASSDLPWIVVAALNARRGSGRLDFFAGHRTGPLDPFASDHTITGLERENFATGVASLDLDGDGRSELVASTPGMEEKQGGIAIFDDPLRAAMSADATARWTGEVRGGLLGNHLFAIGDADGDGRDDLAVAAPELRDEVGQGGSVYVMSGRAQLEGLSVPSEAIATIEGRYGASFGYSAGPAGDLDRDGRADLVFAMKDSSQPVGVLYGPMRGVYDVDTADLRLHPGGAWNLGASSDHMDLDGDGWEELILGAIGSDQGGGSVIVVPGGYTL